MTRAVTLWGWPVTIIKRHGNAWLVKFDGFPGEVWRKRDIFRR